MPRPTLAGLLATSGKSALDAQALARGINVLYGNVGGNLDERDWDFIMRSNDPLTLAESALRSQYQDPGYLQRNAEHIVLNGGSYAEPELGYRAISAELGLHYDPTWSQGTVFQRFQNVPDAVLVNYANDYGSIPFTFESVESGFRVLLNQGGILSFSVAGEALLCLTDPTLVVRDYIQEGFLILKPLSGFPERSSQYAFISTDATVTRSFIDENSCNRIIIVGNGDDEVLAGEGNDTVYGGNGADSLSMMSFMAMTAMTSFRRARGMIAPMAGPAMIGFMAAQWELICFRVALEPINSGLISIVAWT